MSKITISSINYTFDGFDELNALQSVVGSDDKLTISHIDIDNDNMDIIHSLGWSKEEIDKVIFGVSQYLSQVNNEREIIKSYLKLGVFGLSLGGQIINSLIENEEFIEKIREIIKEKGMEFTDDDMCAVVREMIGECINKKY